MNGKYEGRIKGLGNTTFMTYYPVQVCIVALLVSDLSLILPHKAREFEGT